MPAQPLTEEQLEEAARLKAAFQRAKERDPKITQEWLAEQCGWKTQAAVSQYLNGKIPLNIDALSKFAKALDVSPSYISTRLATKIAGFLKEADLTDPALEPPFYGEAPYQHEPGYSNGLMPIRAWEHPEDLPEGEYVFIPRLAVNLSAGAGKEQFELELVKEKPQAFRAEWIRQQRLKPDALASMTAHGESMEPRIYEGDALIVDTSQTNVIDGKVYALWYDGGERVKRLIRRPGGGLIIRSDNRARFEDISLTPEESDHVRIIGRVVHIAGNGGL
jgi:phage repressor protein C with HTH and peptisase S24 domain